MRVLACAEGEPHVEEVGEGDREQLLMRHQAGHAALPADESGSAFAVVCVASSSGGQPRFIVGRARKHDATDQVTVIC